MTTAMLRDWGEPRPADWRGPREPLPVRLPPDLVREVRIRAREQGISVSRVVERLIEAGLQGRPTSSGSMPGDLVTTLFD